jgi:hypothetical protein
VRVNALIVNQAIKRVRKTRGRGVRQDSGGVFSRDEMSAALVLTCYNAYNDKILRELVDKWDVGEICVWQPVFYSSKFIKHAAKAIYLKQIANNLYERVASIAKDYDRLKRIRVIRHPQDIHSDRVIAFLQLDYAVEYELHQLIKHAPPAPGTIHSSSDDRGLIRPDRELLKKGGTGSRAKERLVIMKPLQFMCNEELIAYMTKRGKGRLQAYFQRLLGSIDVIREDKRLAAKLNKSTD